MFQRIKTGKTDIKINPEHDVKLLAFLEEMMNKTLKNQIIKAIKQQDLASYQRLRYQAYPDGEPIVFNKVDFRQVDFSSFNCFLGV